MVPQKKLGAADGTKSKDSSHLRQARCDNRRASFGEPSPHCNAASPVPNITIQRRQNVLTLFQQFAEEQMRTGVAPKGLEQTFARHLQISPSMWSQIKSSRPIGDKLARQIEAACGREGGWLDAVRASEGLTASEQQFLATALKTWRTTNADGRKRLRAVLRKLDRIA